MKELKIASFETVKLAVQKGFDWIESDDKFYDCYGELDFTFQGYKESVTEYSRYPAPSLELIKMWLREVHDICVEAYQDYDPKDGAIQFYTSWRFYKSDTIEKKQAGWYDEYNDWKIYEDALEFAISEALKLIK